MNHRFQFLETLDVDAVLKGQGADPVKITQRTPSLLKIAQSALDLGLHLVEPAYFRKSFSLSCRDEKNILIENSLLISSKRIVEILRGAEGVELVVCTIGTKLENLSTSYFSTDAALALALDGLANAAIDCLTEFVCCEIDQEARSEGLRTSLPVSPGSDDWPLEIGQPAIFDAVKPDPSIIRLTESFSDDTQKIRFVLGWDWSGDARKGKNM